MYLCCCLRMAVFFEAIANCSFTRGYSFPGSAGARIQAIQAARHRDGVEPLLGSFTGHSHGLAKREHHRPVEWNVPQKRKGKSRRMHLL